MSAIPPTFAPYRDILGRLGDCRPSGQGLSVRCLFPERHHNDDKTPSARVWIGGRGELVCRCMACGATWGDYVKAVGLPSAAWWPQTEERYRAMSQTAPVKIQRETARYVYCDRDGEYIAEKIRLEPGRHDRAKDFVWERRLDSADVERLGYQQTITRVVGLAEGWYSPTTQKNGSVSFHLTVETNERSVSMRGVAHLLSLYKLPELLKSNLQSPILVCEGEKVADEMRRIGYVATTGYAGFQKWAHRWGQDFAGRRVAIIPDRDPNDEALEYAYRAAASAMYYQASEVRIVLVPSLQLPPKGGDICHWLEGRGIAPEDTSGRYEAVRELCRKSDRYSLTK